MSSLPSREQLVRQVLVRAATEPPALFLGTAGLLLLASPAAAPIGAAALLGAAGWIGWRVRDRRFAEASGEELIRSRWRELITRLEDVAARLDGPTSTALVAIVEAHERLLGLYRERSALMPATRVELTSLLQHCLTLAEKRSQLQLFIAGFQAQEVQRDALQLQARMERSHDPVTRRLYEEALEQKRQELENYVRLEEAVARIDSQLAAIRCTFDNLVSRVVRLQASDAAAEDGEQDPLVTELDRLNRGVADLEASLNETLTLRGVA